VSREATFDVPGGCEIQRFLKNCTARSCFSAAVLDAKVPRFLRLPVLAFFLREYKRYSPDFSLRIMRIEMPGTALRLVDVFEHLVGGPVNHQGHDDQIADQI